MYKVYFGDSLGVIHDNIDSDSIAVVIAGPPFWGRCITGAEGELGAHTTKDDFLKGLESIFYECYRILIPGGKMLVQAGQIYPPKNLKETHKLVNLPFDFYDIITNVEDFQFGGSIHYVNKFNSQRRVHLGSYPNPGSIPVSNQVEEILTFAKSGKRNVDADAKLASKVTKEEFREFSSPLWEFNERLEKIASPIGLTKRLIKFYSFIGDMVLDPFLGHGTTMQASMETDRDCIGIEINSKFESDIREMAGARVDEVEFVY